MDLTFIEVMPMGDLGPEQDRIGQYWSLKDLRRQLAEQYSLKDLAHRTGGPARYVELIETAVDQRVEQLGPLLRLTCTGELFMCLGQEDNADLRTPLRASEGDAALEEAIRLAISRKPKGHDFDYSRQRADGQVTRHMSHTGG